MSLLERADAWAIPASEKSILASESGSLLFYTAHHEAGHTVANLSFGIPITEVWISPTGHGCVRRAYSSPDPFIELVSSLAGPMAEQRAGGDGAWEGEAEQLLSAKAALSKVEATRAYYHTSALLTAEWVKVLRLARALIQHEWIYGAELELIIA